MAAVVVPAAKDIVLKEGWAVKESGQAFMGQTNWKRRLCRLIRSTDGVVTWAYYRKIEDINSGQRAGYVELDSTYLARDLEMEERKKKPNCFALGPVFDDLARRTYYISCDSLEDKLSWMEVIGAAIETDTSSTDMFEHVRRSIRSRMERRTKRTRQHRTQSSPSTLMTEKEQDYMNPVWRLEQWKTMCSVIKESIWKKSDTKNGVTLSRLSFKHENCAVIKVEGDISVPPEVIFDYLLTALRPGGKLDQPFRNESVLQIIEDSIPQSSIVSNTYSMPMPSMSTRECCLIRTWMPSYLTQDNTCGLVVSSLSHPLAQVSKTSIGVHIQPSGFALFPVQAPDGSLHTLACVLGQVDLQDSLQTMLEATFKSGLLKIGLRTVFSHIKSQLEKYYAIVQS